MYLNYEEYLTINPKNLIDEFDYNAYEMEAEMLIDKFTMSLDGVRKLQVAFPTDEHSVRAVRTCMAALISKISTIAKLKTSLLEKTTNGEGVVSSKSSGSESISYATNLNVSEMKLATDDKEREKALYILVRKYLMGIQDANGVNLFYGGCYPCIKTQ